jgi:hypothetical protein
LPPIIITLFLASPRRLCHFQHCRHADADAAIDFSFFVSIIYAAAYFHADYLRFIYWLRHFLHWAMIFAATFI